MGCQLAREGDPGTLVLDRGIVADPADVPDPDNSPRNQTDKPPKYLGGVLAVQFSAFIGLVREVTVSIEDAVQLFSASN
jgi:hypothetical protein